ncbi:MAG: hypothetical protein V4717_18080 [Bacteroidota bacterium]
MKPAHLIPATSHLSFLVVVKTTFTRIATMIGSKKSFSFDILHQAGIGKANPGFIT